jgi:hypothetical protein
MVDIPPGNIANGAKLFKTRCGQCHVCEKVPHYGIIVMTIMTMWRIGRRQQIGAQLAWPVW